MFNILRHPTKCNRMMDEPPQRQQQHQEAPFRIGQGRPCCLALSCQRYKYCPTSISFVLTFSYLINPCSNSVAKNFDSVWIPNSPIRWGLNLTSKSVSVNDHQIQECMKNTALDGSSSNKRRQNLQYRGDKEYARPRMECRCLGSKCNSGNWLWWFVVLQQQLSWHPIPTLEEQSISPDLL